MSLCIRTLSNKLTCLVGTRNAATLVDRQLPKHIEKRTSTFFDEFLSGRTSTTKEGRDPSVSANLAVKPLKTTSDNIVAWNYKLRSDGNCHIGKREQDCVRHVDNNFSNDLAVHDSSAKVFSVAEEGAARSESSTEPQTDNPLGKPTQEQLNHIYEVLRVDLPSFFIKSVDYRIYHPEIVFENNIKGTVTRGIYEYVKQTAMLRIIGHLKFAYVKFDVLKITVHPEDSSVKVRWRIRGLSGTKVFFQFWKFKLWKLQESVDQIESWHDGFSTFYVDDSGRVVKHVADKMMPDQDVEVTTKDKTGMATKLALFLGLLTPREFLTDIGPLTFIGVDDVVVKHSTKTADRSVENNSKSYNDLFSTR